MKNKQLIEMLRKIEDHYQRASQNIPLLGECFPNAAAFFVFALSVVAPQLGALFVFSYMLNRMTNRIPSLQKVVIESYDRQLSISHDSENREVDQGLLVRQANPLVNLPSLLLIPAELDMVNDLLTMATQGAIPSLAKMLDKKTDTIFRQRRTDLIAKMNYDGACYGLMMAWHVAVTIGEEEEFLADIAEIARIAQSFRAQTLSVRQEMWIKIINQAQEDQEGELSIEVVTKQGKVVVCLKKEFAKTYRISARDYNFPEQKVEITVLTDNDEPEVDVRSAAAGEAFFKAKKLFADNTEQKQFNNNLHAIAETAIQRAIKNPGKLIDLSVIKPDAAHAIGVAAHYIKGQWVLDYFDSNVRRARFLVTNRTGASAGLVNLLKYEYRSYFNEFQRRENIQLTTYSTTAVCLEDKPANNTQMMVSSAYNNSRGNSPLPVNRFINLPAKTPGAFDDVLFKGMFFSATPDADDVLFKGMFFSALEDAKKRGNPKAVEEWDKQFGLTVYSRPR